MMDAAFLLQAAEARVALVLVLGRDRSTRMPVSHGRIALFEERAVYRAQVKCERVAQGPGAPLRVNTQEELLGGRDRVAPLDSRAINRRAGSRGSTAAL